VASYGEKATNHWRFFLKFFCRNSKNLGLGLRANFAGSALWPVFLTNYAKNRLAAQMGWSIG